MEGGGQAAQAAQHAQQAQQQQQQQQAPGETPDEAPAPGEEALHGKPSEQAQQAEGACQQSTQDVQDAQEASTQPGKGGRKKLKEPYTDIEDVLIVRWVSARIGEQDIVSGRNMATSMHLWHEAETKGVVPGRTASSIRQRWCNKLRNKYIAEARARLAGQAVAAVGGAGEDKHAAGPAAGSADAGDPVPPAADSVEAPRYSFKRRGDGSEDDASAGGGSPKRVRLSDEDPFAVAAAAAAAAATAAAAAKGEHPASAPPPVVHISLPPPAVAPASPPPPPMSAERREEVCGWVDTLSRATAVGRRGVVQALLQTNADFAQAFALLQGGPLQPE